jgi:hypothetical protein
MPSGRTIRCVCVTNDDQITVYRTSGGPPISEHLDQETDFQDALWLFDSRTQERNQIAVWFHQVDGKLVADLYQDQDGDGHVSVQIADDDAQITEPGSWSIRTVALDGYWQRNGRIAPNFDLFVDDRFVATFSGQLYEESMANDGVVDVVIHVRGPHGDEPRSYDWRNVYTPVSASSGIVRSTLTVREHGVEPTFAPTFPWYMLGPSLGLVKTYDESFSPIQVDWETGRLTYLGEFVASRGSDENWFTYSLIRVEPGVTTNPNFESPFAFYDLASDQDSIPELMVRVQRTVPDDPYDSAAAAWRGRPYQQIRYVWDQDNTQNWSYKLGLMGQQSIESTVPFPEFTLKSIAYGDFPNWVVQHTWDIASFVAAEKPLWTSEGIYDGDFSQSLRDGYYAGVSANAGTFGNSITTGLRLEIALKFQKQPWLYFSPIDRQLHMESTDSGIWNIDDRRVVRYLNNTGGATFDGWQLWDSNQLTAQLYRVPGGLLYSDETGTFIVNAIIPEQVFRTLPPTTHDEWLTLGQQLKSNDVVFEPGDLRVMFDQFPGAVQVSTEPIAGFRRHADSFSFTVNVATNASSVMLSSLTGMPVATGPQTVTVLNNRWTSSATVFMTPSVAIAVDPINSLLTVPIQVTINNPGSLPLTDATIMVQAVSSDGQTGTVIGTRNVSVDGGGTQLFTFGWAPGKEGNWTIQASVERNVPDARTGAQVTLAQTSQTRVVPSADTITSTAAGQLGWGESLLARIALLSSLLLIAGLGAGIVLWRGLRVK